MKCTEIYIVKTKALFEKGEEGLRGFFELLDKELISRISKKKQEAARCESILSYSLLLSVLLKKGFLKEDLKISFSDSGKPYTIKEIPFSFSVSHTEGAVCVAVGESNSVGVDIEKDLQSITNRIANQKQN